jgi:hypothetical protein
MAMVNETTKAYTSLKAPMSMLPSKAHSIIVFPFFYRIDLNYSQTYKKNPNLSQEKSGFFSVFLKI